MPLGLVCVDFVQHIFVFDPVPATPVPVHRNVPWFFPPAQAIPDTFSFRWPDAPCYHHGNDTWLGLDKDLPKEYRIHATTPHQFRISKTALVEVVRLIDVGGYMPWSGLSQKD
ncbi:MAG TPA: hypothetical protein PLM29_09200 [Deltaproteobacteria bacterium]|jgi:hypothetical protein|nr:hypothetical protein [Deltaproteobacteria bacterium]